MYVLSPQLLGNSDFYFNFNALSPAAFARLLDVRDSVHAGRRNPKQLPVTIDHFCLTDPRNERSMPWTRKVQIPGAEWSLEHMIVRMNLRTNDAFVPRSSSEPTDKSSDILQQMLDGLQILYQEHCLNPSANLTQPVVFSMAPPRQGGFAGQFEHPIVGIPGVFAIDVTPQRANGNLSTPRIRRNSIILMMTTVTEGMFACLSKACQCFMLDPARARMFLSSIVTDKQPAPEAATVIAK